MSSKAKSVLFLLDPGHGSIHNGRYSVISGGKQHSIKDTTIHEGVLNRAVASLLLFKCQFNHIPAQILAPESKDINLVTRANRANELHKRFNCIIISIHHNAFEDPNVHGFELFTSYRETQSDVYAELIAANFEHDFPAIKIRRSSVHGKISKEKPFYILTRTKCPAVLIEWDFMTNPDAYARISSVDGIVEQSEFLFKQIKEIYNLTKGNKA